jgi:CIC family chloride channel protein
VAVGLAVALFEWVTREALFDSVLRAPPWAQAVAPLAGLGLAGLALRWLAGGAAPSTADEYIRNFHDPDRRLPLRPVAGRIVAGVCTLGLGGAMGLEGPSVYLGAAIGSGLQRRFSRLFRHQDAKVLMVAGAAAGVAAIFKAPATGAVFALEVPYQDDTARRMLLPALIASATGYLTFVAFAGTTPLLPVSGSPPFDWRDLGGAVALGLLCGVGARLFAALLLVSKGAVGVLPPLVRVVLAGAILAGLYAGSRALVHEGLTIGPGYRVVEWVTEPRHGVVVVVALLMMRACATAVTVAGGGVGGLFVPLVIEGALLGRAVGDVFAISSPSLFPVIGIAAFLGAGYRTPLAGIVFVAESTGRPGFVVPGLIAAVVAQVVMGRSSVTPYQRSGRGGRLERRFALPISSVLETDVLTAPPDATLEEFLLHHVYGSRQRTVPVVEGGRYLGMAKIGELGTVPRERWQVTVLRDVLTDDTPVAGLDWLLRDAVTAMDEADVDRLPVTDAGGGFVGVVSRTEIFKLEDILEETGEDRW